jgi:hypothetical protein
MADMIIKTSGKNGIEISEFKGEISLIATLEGSGGKDWQKWGKERIGKDSYSEKDRPFKIVLGDKAAAMAVLQKILKELNGQECG